MSTCKSLIWYETAGSVAAACEHAGLRGDADDVVADVGFWLERESQDYRERAERAYDRGYQYTANAKRAAELAGQR